MGSPSERTLLSDMARAQSGYSCKATSTSPSTLELPKPILASPEDANVGATRGVFKLCGSPPRTSELSGTLAFLRAVHLRHTSFTFSSSSESSFAIPTRTPHSAPGFTCNTVSTERIIEWRRGLESGSQVEAPSNSNAPLSSFLPSCDSSSTSSSVSHQARHRAYPTTRVRVEHIPPYQPSSGHPRDLYQDEAASKADDDEDNAWPYDGRGLYEHHSKRECGNACFVSCQLRRKIRPRFTGLARFVPRLKIGKLGEKRKMKNSDVPHPPWELEYRSNDDSLDEDHDDGDLEVWLEYVAEKQRINHELRLELCLDGRPDSRIFSF